MSESEQTEEPFSVTDSAIKQALSLLEDQEEVSTEDWGIRVFVQQGGCAGLSYGLRFDQPEDDDVTFRKEGLLCIIDPASNKYISGSVLDYKSGLQNTGFTFNNPNVVSECGCGESFRT